MSFCPVSFGPMTFGPMTILRISRQISLSREHPCDAVSDCRTGSAPVTLNPCNLQLNRFWQDPT
jgi:hypothetical protein